MEYLQDTYAYPPSTQSLPMFYQPLQYPAYMQHDPHITDYYPQYSYSDYADFMHPGSMAEDYEEMGEVSSRPRLTKEQVDVLESQFQAHPKPNSMIKRQLASQTKLTLPRVANWFQNRRAKAKQQKKQEEFEISQTLALHDESCPTTQFPESPGKAALVPVHTSSPVRHVSTPHSRAQSPQKHVDPSQMASWASLNRAIEAAQAAQRRDAQELSTQMNAMLPLRQTRPSVTRSMSSNGQTNMFDLRSSARPSPLPAWSSPPSSNEIAGFDFGFNQTDLASAGSNSQKSTSDGSPSGAGQTTYAISPEAWQDSLETPRMSSFIPPGLTSDLHTPSHEKPAYLSSRRGSNCDELTSTMNTFDLAETSPRRNPSAPLRLPNGDIDLAARRKRPRPTALQSTALRSRSYGALTASSPTVKACSMPPATHTVRHSKSLHNLNSRYAGIRKSSSAQRSPMVATFAESEAYNRLMAQQAIINAKHQTSTEAPVVSNMHSTSPELLMISTQMPFRNKSVPTASTAELPAQYLAKLANGQHVVVSPPQTPFEAEFMLHNNAQAMMPTVTGSGQYATFADLTPPYSAGPLTNSSWSDAPLTSPELPAYTQMQYVPGTAFAAPLDFVSQFPQFMLPSDTKSEFDLNGYSDKKKTEFFIQEFPNQREEHAQVAKQMAQQRPKHYTFNNSAAHDFDQE